jgi:hypothetical protein
MADAHQRAKTALLWVASGSDPAPARRASRTVATFGDLAQELSRALRQAEEEFWKDDQTLLDISGWSL